MSRCPATPFWTECDSYAVLDHIVHECKDPVACAGAVTGGPDPEYTPPWCSRPYDHRGCCTCEPRRES